jgi:glycosyltransferase involved in cell wall biosynthesis
MIEVHDRPLITFALFAYNQEKFIREAVEGAFAQTYSPLEIILSDDCSSDGTFNVIQAITAAYRRPHKVLLNRNTHNLGLAAHINRVMELSSGELIVAAAGDDVSLPRRVETTHAVWEGCSRPDYLFFGIEVFSDDASATKQFVFDPETLTPLGMIGNCGMTLVAPAEAWHRRVFEVFGPLPPGIMTEDKSIAFRAALLGGVVFTSYPLVRYRIHGGNISRDVHCDRQGRRAARSRSLRWQRARLEGFAHDLRTALARRLLDEEHAAKLQQAIDRKRAWLQWRLASVEGGVMTRWRAGLMLGSMTAPDGRVTWRHRAGSLWRAIRGV